jgi:hypothetical protein
VDDTTFFIESEHGKVLEVQVSWGPFSLIKVLLWGYDGLLCPNISSAGSLLQVT